MLDRAVERLRVRFRRFDHFWRAQERFFEVQGGLLSAAIAYYAFFAVLSLSLLSLSVLGYLLELPPLYDIVEKWLAENLPIIDADSIADSRQTTGLIALAVLAITGVRWVQSIRSAIRAVWLLNPEPGHPLWRILVDCFVLVALGLLLIVTLTVTAGVEVVLHWLSDGYSVGIVTRAISYGGTAIGVLVNTVLAAALLSGLPRLALPVKRLLPAALWVALGLELLKTLGAMYIISVEARPAYQAVGTAVGLLIFLYVFNQMLLFAASWTATSSRGNVLDMADDRRRVGVPALEAAPPEVLPAEAEGGGDRDDDESEQGLESATGNSGEGPGEGDFFAADEPRDGGADVASDSVVPGTTSRDGSDSAEPRSEPAGMRPTTRGDDGS